MARIAEDLLLLLLDNDSAQPLLHRSRLGRVLAAALILDLAYDCRVRPALATEPLPPGHLIALAGPVPMDPAVRKTLVVIQHQPISALAAIANARKHSEDDVLAQLLRRGKIRQFQLSAHRLRRNTYAWPIIDRSRVEQARAGLRAALVERTLPGATTAAIIGLLHSADALGNVLRQDTIDAAEADARAVDITGGAWVDDANAAEVNLAATAAEVLPTLVQSLA